MAEGSSMKTWQTKVRSLIKKLEGGAAMLKLLIET